MTETSIVYAERTLDGMKSMQDYIFLQGILERNVFEDEQNFPRDNFSLSAIISKLSAERSEARHS